MEVSSEVVGTPGNGFSGLGPSTKASNGFGDAARYDAMLENADDDFLERIKNVFVENDANVAARHRFLLNSISTENFSVKFSAANCRHISTQN
jgi:hypothetical protein